MNKQLVEYSIQGEAHAMNVYLFEDGSDYDKTLAYKFLFQYGHRIKDRRKPSNRELGKKVMDWFYQILLRQTEEDYSMLLDLADVVQMYVPNRVGEVMNAVRARDAQFNGEIRDQVQERVRHQNQPIRSDGPKNTVYADTQSVHDTAINESVKRAAQKLCEDYETNKSTLSEMYKLMDMVEPFLYKRFGPQKYIKDCMKRIRTDNANFNIGLHLCNIFSALWIFILNHKNREDLFQRLNEELREMHNKCASGYCSRLINVTQGYSDRYEIHISNKQQIKAVVSHYLNGELQNCEDDEVMEGMLDFSEKYREFIRQAVKSRWNEWIAEYGEQLNIIKAINDHAGCKVL